MFYNCVINNKTSFFWYFNKRVKTEDNEDNEV